MRRLALPCLMLLVVPASAADPPRGATRPATLALATGGAECFGAAVCTLTLRWDGERLQPVR